MAAPPLPDEFELLKKETLRVAFFGQITEEEESAMAEGHEMFEAGDEARFLVEHHVGMPAHPFGRRPDDRAVLGVEAFDEIEGFGRGSYQR